MIAGGSGLIRLERVEAQAFEMPLLQRAPNVSRTRNFHRRNAAWSGRYPKDC